MPWNVDDPSQKEAFERETSKLWNITTNYDSFFFKTLQDVLDDYYECLRTIDEDIAEIKDELLLVHQNFTKVDEKFDDVDEKIDDVEEKLDDVESEVISNKMQSDEAEQCLRDDVADINETTSEIQQKLTNIEKLISTNKNDIEEKLECSISDSWLNDTYVIGLLEGEASDREIADQTIQGDINQLEGDINTIMSDISSNNDDIKDNMEKINTINSNPRFAAELRPTTGYFLSVGDITDYNELIDVNNNFDPVTGKFSVYQDGEEGTYMFLLSGFKSYAHKQRGVVYLYKNGEIVKVSIWNNDHDHSTDHEFVTSTLVTLHLQKGDEVKLDNRGSASVYVDSENPFTFTGYKI